jgi:hypothetical protein
VGDEDGVADLALERAQGLPVRLALGQLLVAPAAAGQLGMVAAGQIRRPSSRALLLIECDLSSGVREVNN